MAETKKIVQVEELVLDDLNTKYVYVLALKNEPRGRVFDADGMPIKDQEYPGRRNLLLRSSIIWPGGKDPFSGKERQRGKHLIRYYDGCTTLFIDDQPKEKETIDILVASTRELHFIRGFLDIYGYEAILKMYMDWCSWNAESPYRVAKVDAVFMMMDGEKQRRLEAEAMNMEDDATEYAKKASVKHMRIHAKFLDIADIDLKTSQPLSDASLRTEYRKAAKSNPAFFIRTYNDKTIHIKHWIEEALKTGQISTTIIPNKAVWSERGVEICDISGLKSKEGILNKLIEFSQLKEGAEFKEHLEAFNN